MGIAYLTKGTGSPACPTWLADWKPRAGTFSLCHRDVEGGHMVGVCNPLAFNPAGRWRDLGDGWSVGRIPGSTIDHQALARDVLWCDVLPVRDLRDAAWLAPVILTEAGSRAFRVSYGSDWLPALTDEQARAEHIAEAARSELLKGEDSALEMPVACQWAAELLSLTHHLHPGVFAALSLLDDRLVPEVLGAAAGLALEVTRHGDS